MRLLIAPTAFKGSLSARETAEVIAAALPGSVQPVICPVADGGDGTLECLVNRTGGRVFERVVRGPIVHRPVQARWGVLGDGATAVIEMAEAAGWRLLPHDKRDVMNATTFGVGELVRTVLESGYRRILVGLGGSATNDCGMGFAQALGVHFIDKNGRELADGGGHLGNLHRIDTAELHPAVPAASFIGLADVVNPLIGPNGAARTFAPQKGASPEEVERLEDAARHFSWVVRATVGTDISSVPGTGAAGGLAASLAVFCKADIVSGIDFILELMLFDALLKECDAVVTAEGTLDKQTSYGKAIAGITRRARAANKPVHVFAGRIEGDPRQVVRSMGFASAHAISPPGLPVDVAMRRTSDFLGAAVRGFFDQLLER